MAGIIVVFSIPGFHVHKSNNFNLEASRVGLRQCYFTSARIVRVFELRLPCLATDVCGRHSQVESLARAAQLSNDNAGVLRQAERHAVLNPSDTPRPEKPPAPDARPSRHLTHFCHVPQPAPKHSCLHRPSTWRFFFSSALEARQVGESASGVRHRSAVKMCHLRHSWRCSFPGSSSLARRSVCLYGCIWQPELPCC